MDLPNVLMIYFLKRDLKYYRPVYNDYSESEDDWNNTDTLISESID